MRRRKAELRARVNGQLRFRYTRTGLTSYAGLELVRRWLHRDGLVTLLPRERATALPPTDYGVVGVVLVILALVLSGGRRLRHLRYLGGDPVVLPLADRARQPPQRVDNPVGAGQPFAVALEVAQLVVRVEILSGQARAALQPFAVFTDPPQFDQRAVGSLVVIVRLTLFFRHEIKHTFSIDGFYQPEAAGIEPPVCFHFGNDAVAACRDEKIQLLEALPGWSWDVLEGQWDEGFEQLQLYVNLNGNASVPAKHVTLDGFKLGNWVGTQRKNKAQKLLSRDRIERLEALPGWVWSFKKATE